MLELNHENLDDFDCRPLNKEPLSEAGKSFVEAARQKRAEKEPAQDEFAVPHTCGDEPVQKFLHLLTNPCSPHLRG